MFSDSAHGKQRARRNSRPRGMAAFILLLFFLFITPGPTPAGPPAGKLDRLIDRVIVSAGQLNKTRGRPISNLRLLAFSAGKLSPIPFQIDERNAKGGYILNRLDGKVVRDEDGGKLDSNDELVFMAADGGERGEPAKVFAGVPADEIQLTDPVSGLQVYVYFLAFDKNPPPLSPADYIRFRHTEARDSVVTPYYTLNFPPNNVFMEDLIIHRAAGGNDQDILDKIKMRSGVKLLSGSFTVNRTEQDFNHKLIGWVDGPIRVIRQTETSLSLVLSLRSPSATVNACFYPYSFEFPSILSLPFRMDLVASDAYIRQGFDLNRNALGMKFFSNTFPQGVTFDGKMSPEEEKLAHDRRTHVWGILSGAPGALIYEGIWDRKSPITARLYYRDDLNFFEKPENDPGSLTFAYLLEDVLKMGGEEYPFNIVNYILPHYDGNQAGALRVFDKPLQVKVNP